MLFLSCACLGQSVRDVASVAFKSVVLLEMKDSDGQPLSLGSGFFVSNGIIATNMHVIEGASGGTAKLVGNTHTMQILGTVAVDRHADLTLLQVGGTAPSLVLGPNQSPNVGDTVYVVGNPLGLEGTFSEGIISGVRHLDADTILQMTAPISPGSSGGPVMDSSGAVVGIAVATFRGGQNLNLAVPVAYLSRLLKSRSNVPVPLESKTAAGRADDSMLEGVGTETEKGLVVTDYQLEWDEGDLFGKGKFEFRLTNKLPVGISNIHLLFLYYDANNALMDYEKLDVAYYLSHNDPVLPAGLAKTIHAGQTGVSHNSAEYYRSKGIAPKVDIRVLGFKTEQPE
jgi:hypothetical protein